ncbi:MAG: trans-sulfuration enzyme family protein [Actinomycetales bacterium]
MTDLETRAVHAGREDLTGLGVHVPPIDLSTTYPIPDIDSGGRAYELLAAGQPPGSDTGSLVYQRLWNPTVARFEQAVADLEGCEAGAAFATGMAAVSAALLSRVSAGRGHVVGVRPVYGGTEHLLNTGLLGTSVTWAPVDGIRAALTPQTGLVVVETPANPTLDLIDIESVVAAAGSVPVLVDNTFATPVLQQPARHGAALVLHSATKFLGGHGDLMGGVVVGSPGLIAEIRSVRALTGALLYPYAAYQLHRGLQTLPARVRAAQESATTIARWLEDRPEVARVHYPGLNGTGDLVGTQMRGPGSVLAIELHGGFCAADRVARQVRLVTHAVSLGGVDTLIEHPAALTHRPVAQAGRPHAGLLRISVGLESVRDLINDLEGALKCI